MDIFVSTVWFYFRVQSIDVHWLPKASFVTTRPFSLRNNLIYRRCRNWAIKVTWFNRIGETNIISDTIFFLGVMPLLNLGILLKWNILLKQFVSATPETTQQNMVQLVVVKYIMCRFWFIFFFWRVTPILNLEILPKLNVRLIILKLCAM